MDLNWHSAENSYNRDYSSIAVEASAVEEGSDTEVVSSEESRHTMIMIACWVTLIVVEVVAASSVEEEEHPQEREAASFDVVRVVMQLCW